MKKNKLFALWIPALIIVILDQITKHLVRTTPSLQNLDIIPGWLSFHYTQNPGMALGMDWASTPVISGIAILATIGIIVYVIRSLDHAKLSYLVCMGLVLGGAFGNIIDRLIMGYLESYGGILEGHVIDFIHFTLHIDGYPVFPYIFNVADMSISVAIISMLVFHQRIIPEPQENDDDQQEIITPAEQSGVANAPLSTEASTEDEEKESNKEIVPPRHIPDSEQDKSPSEGNFDQSQSTDQNKDS